MNKSRLRSGLLAPLVLFITACASIASVVYPLNTEAEQIKPGEYALDPSHAHIIFSVSHFGFSTSYGRFNTISGSLDFDAENPQNSRLSISVEAESIDTNNAVLEGLLKAEAMFNSAVHPTVTFVSTAIETTGDNTGVVTGDLTIAGVTKPLALNVTFTGSGTNPASGIKTVGFDATGSLLRSEFGLKDWLPFVGDEVTLQIAVEFNPSKQ